MLSKNQIFQNLKDKNCIFKLKELAVILLVTKICETLLNGLLFAELVIQLIMGS